MNTLADERPQLGVRAALLYGNFAIGCGVMVVAGSLNDLVRSLGVSVADCPLSIGCCLAIFRQ